jgi:hypothetical protein
VVLASGHRNLPGRGLLLTLAPLPGTFQGLPLFSDCGHLPRHAILGCNARRCNNRENE